MATETDWQAYQTSVVDIDLPNHQLVRVIPDDPGKVGTWPDGVDGPLSILTAWNPDSVVTDDESNAVHHTQLLADLDSLGVTYWPAIGRDPRGIHHEVGVAVVDLSEGDALLLGRDHGQAAFYRWTSEAWEVVSCTDNRRHVMGWRLEVR